MFGDKALSQSVRQQIYEQHPQGLMDFGKPEKQDQIGRFEPQMKAGGNGMKNKEQAKPVKDDNNEARSNNNEGRSNMGDENWKLEDFLMDHPSIVADQQDYIDDDIRDKVPIFDEH